jgi:hypothetical protein
MNHDHNIQHDISKQKILFIPLRRCMKRILHTAIKQAVCPATRTKLRETTLLISWKGCMASVIMSVNIWRWPATGRRPATASLFAPPDSPRSCNYRGKLLRRWSPGSTILSARSTSSCGEYLVGQLNTLAPCLGTTREQPSPGTWSVSRCSLLKVPDSFMLYLTAPEI